MPSARKVALIGVPLDLGASKRGAAGGPAAIRRAELSAHLEALGIAVEDSGDLLVHANGHGPAGGAQAALAGRGSEVKHAEAIRRACEDLARETCAALKLGRTPVVLGGDHSLAMGSIAGVARRLRETGGKLGVVWVDAHADINTPRTSPSGNLHGMPLSHLLGLGDPRLSRLAGFAPALDPSRVCLVGIRDVDEGERKILRDTGVSVFTMADIDRRGMARVAERAVAVAGRGGARIHVSFDVDAADPSIAQGVGTPKRGGLTYREAHLLMEIIAESKRLISLDMVEVNPLEDIHNTTAELAAELILSALGKRIY